MPRKLRELIADLERVGFVMRSGKGSHRVLSKASLRVVLSGRTGDDALAYQERDAARAIESMKSNDKGKP